MKLSQVLKDWPGSRLTREEREVYGLTTVGSKYDEGFNTALTSCDREIDREALAKIVYGLKSVFKNPNHYSLKEQEKMALDDVETIISTMPTWLKRSDGE